MPKPTEDTNILDVIYKLAMIIIAASNAAIAVYIYVTKDKKENEVKDNDIRVSWLKNLILDYNLEKFYEFYDEALLILAKLKSDSELSDDVKSLINEELGKLFSDLRRDFIDIFRAVDERFYDKLIFQSDSLQDFLTEEIFKVQNNFNNEETFKEVVDEALSASKTEIIKIIFNYRGKSKEN